MPVKKCSKCGTAFKCGAEKKGCWCENYQLGASTLEQLSQEYDNCLCESCIQTYVLQQNAANNEELPINS